MSAARVEQLFSEAGAYRAGHFKLKSGRHADRYVEKFQVLQWPTAVTELCAMIVVAARPAGVDVVVGPTTGGVILAFEVARQLGVRGMFAEHEQALDGTARRVFRRGFQIGAGERVLLVDDVVTTGASLREMIEPIEAAGGELVEAIVLVDRTGGLHDVPSSAGRRYPAHALWSLQLPTYDAGSESCPGCRTGVPLEAPGSSGVGSVT
ncbi:phosphoribosyltransferase family protein [soil metagenome]